ncbi:MAG: hypothetical protein AAGF78_09535 [Pseudomonadota bacterium]
MLMKVGVYLVVLPGFAALLYWHLQLMYFTGSIVLDFPKEKRGRLAEFCLEDDRFRHAGKRWLQSIAFIVLGLAAVMSLFYLNSKLCLFPMTHAGVTICSAA